MKRKALLNLHAGRLLLALMTGLPAVAAAASPILVCYPGGPVDEAQANTAMGAMLRVVERVGGWPENSYTSAFTARIEECRQLLDSRKPVFAITSLGLFLEQRDAQHWLPVVQPRMQGATAERYRLVAARGKFSALDGLRGKTVGGTVFTEPDFIRKIVFAGRIDPQTYFDLQPSRQAIRALRALERGELDAVLLSGQQYGALASLQLKTPLEAVFTSADIPLMGMVANSQSSTSEERARMAKALQDTCADGEGRKLCDLFGIEGFVPANPAAIDPAIRLWQQEK